MFKRILISAVLSASLICMSSSVARAQGAAENVEYKLLDLQLIAGEEKVAQAPMYFQAFALSDVDNTQVRFYQNNHWTDWERLAYEEERANGSSIRFIETSSAFALISNKTTHVKVTLMNFRNRGYEVTESGKIMSDVGVDVAYGDADDALKIISRKEWGADESLGTYVPDENGEENGSDSGNICAPLEKAFPNQYQVTDKVDYFDGRGRNLKWPRTYSNKVKKIVVHHTAQDMKDLNGDSMMNGKDYRLAVQAIYTYHALTRGWGDIG